MKVLEGKFNLLVLVDQIVFTLRCAFELFPMVYMLALSYFNFIRQLILIYYCNCRLYQMLLY